MMESISCPIEVAVNDRRNENVGFSIIDAPVKALFLSDKIYLESWEEDHRRMMRKAQESGSDRAIFKTDEATIYVDRFNYFYIGSNVEFSIKGKRAIPFGINTLS